MSNIWYEPFHEFGRFMDETLFPYTGDRYPRRLTEAAGGGEGTVRTLRPKMDLHEDANKNLVTATFELPGVRKEDVQIDVHDNRLTVSAESKMSQDYDENGYAVRERRFGKFSRTLQLPSGIKDSDVKASLEQGILNITFPKSGAEQAPKRITVT